MQLFVGLGNPGGQYAGHRHNIGFMALDAIASREGAAGWRAKFQGEIAEIRIGSGKILLLKPGTFMNLSGQAVGEAARFYDIAPEEVTVFHDELDLAPGRLKVKRGGGHAGHNGLRSIHQHIGAEYRRVRLGIGHPGHKDRVSGYVLHDFSRTERAWVDPLIDAVARSIAMLAAGDDPGFMTEVARLAPAPGKEARDPPPPSEAKQTRQGPATAASKEAEGSQGGSDAGRRSPFDALRGLLKP
ncbi:MAG: aminoacyl-tRNA hydrolase [Pseudomonadota bacterium]